MAVNKPNGVPIRQSDDAPSGLVQALPALAERIGVKKLIHVLAPER